MTTRTTMPFSTSNPPTSNTRPPPSIPIPTPPLASDIGPARGVTPWAAQIAAVPAVLLELNANPSFEATFAPLVPSVSNLATDLANAAAWTSLRKALAEYLVYAKSQEILMWREAKAELDALDVVFQGVAAHHPRLLDDFPALTQLLDVTKQSAQRGVATRVARAKVKAAHEAEAAKAATEGTIASKS